MKVWKTELILRYDDSGNWMTSFHFKLQDGEYKENKNFNEWTCFKDWVSNTIPMNISVRPNVYGGLKVVQGIDHSLTENELQVLESEMKRVLKEHLEAEKEIYLKTYLEKIKTISD